MAQDDLIARIRAAAKSKGVSQTALARVAGMPSQSAISNVFAGKRKLTIEEASALRVHLELDEGPSAQLVPLIGLASASSWNEAVVMPMGYHPIPRGLAGPRAFAVEIKGDSMDKLLPEGGWAVVDPDNRRLYDKKVYLVENGDHDTTVKRYRSDPARFEPVSHNTLHQTLFVEGLAYHVIGRVVSYGNTAGL